MRIHADPSPDSDPGQNCKSEKKLIFTRKIRLPNNDPDPGEPNQCGPMRIRIHNTALSTHAAPTPTLNV
jgi:hypothetical protein